MSQKIKSNLKRCPLIKVKRKSMKRDDRGDIVFEEVVEEFNDCYKSFCMAWDEKTKSCAYFQTEVEEAEPEED